MARVEQFRSARFNAEPNRAQAKRSTPAAAPGATDGEESAALPPKEESVIRGARRARQRVYDAIMCNQDLDAFVTFTYSPETVGDKADYAECYPYLKNWLSNAVQRDGLKYVCVPELTKKGDVHFHALCNFDALRVAPAINPHTGRPIMRGGKPVFNLTAWGAGFSTCQRIECRKDGDDHRLAVARYIWKYMGKNLGAKVGGRYALMGGELAKPVHLFGEYPEEFMTEKPRKTHVVEVSEGETYTKYEFK